MVVLSLKAKGGEREQIKVDTKRFKGCDGCISCSFYVDITHNVPTDDGTYGAWCMCPSTNQFIKHTTSHHLHP
jgi:hypothetical protein